ncbi:N-acetylmuramoyl-L-alanine amidase [Phormidium tenue FACHB-886]|nr:N-acetylmuramoyl-L-alanine amidase [Phormidium tenue FACHB-886]
MRFHWLLPSLVGAFGLLLSVSPASAGELRSWQFTDNELTLTTDDGTQPRVELVSNPTRLVIDLPGTTLGRSRINQSVGGAIREIRVAQFNAQTTRFVIELSSGYTIDPDEVEVRGSSAEQWTVQLPEPERSTEALSLSDPLPIPVTALPPTGTLTPSTPAAQPSLAQAIEADTQLEEVRVTQDGFFFRTSGDKPDIEQEYSNDRRQLVIELEDTAISPRLTQRDLPVDRYRVSRIQLVQVADEDPPLVRITLEIAEDSPEWRATAVSLGGVVLVRVGGLAAGAAGERTSQSLTPRPAPTPSPNTPNTSQISRTPQPSIERPSPAPIVPSGSVELPNVADRRVRIAIDPGHGGRDPGAVGIDGLQEKGIVLDIALKVTQLLEEQGAQVILTRQDDREIDLEPRVQDANQGRANVFVSIHANAIDLSRPDINGVETYYYSSSEGAALAQAIQSSVAQSTGMRNIGVKQARFFVLRRTLMPAVLVEVGFVTGRDDAPRLADPDFRTLMAEAIARGILEYVQRTL